MLVFTKGDLNSNKEKEWIITNGLGSYSSSTITNLNTRKQHGILVASLNKPFNRKVLVSSFEEELIIGKEHFNLKNNLEEFNFHTFPKFNYRIKEIDIIKSTCMVQDHNAVIISYKIISNKYFKFIVRPFINSRSLNYLTKEPEWVFNQIANQRTTVIKPSHEKAPLIMIGSDKANYKTKGSWHYDINYKKDLESENLFCPGEFTLEVNKGITNLNFLVIGDKVDEAYLSFDNLYSNNEKEYAKFFEYATNRKKSITQLYYNIHRIKESNFLQYLVQSADSFIVKNEKYNEKIIVSGYPYLTSSGRDSLSSLPGLCLATGRINDAKDILTFYAKHCKKGLIPDVNENNDLEYNSIDASLWFIYSCYKFYKNTDNLEFIRLNLWQKIKEIIDNYKRRTALDISMKSDGLISSDLDLPLTWMNQIRKGKCIEVNALWYNALKITELFAKRFKEDFEEYLVISNLVKKSINEKFWNEKEKCLYDEIGSKHSNSNIIPNQIFAISLPFRILDKHKEILVLKKVTNELLTPYGLKISNTDNDNLASSWLIGPYISAYLRLHDYSKYGIQEIEEKIIKHIHHILRSSCIGSIPELQSNTYPYKSAGCPSHALAVAELLRAYTEDILKENV